MKEMIIDIGSNTVKYKIFNENQGKIQEAGSGSRAIRLIDHIQEGILRAEGEKLLQNTLQEYKNIAEQEGCVRVFPFATASFRKISHPEEVISRIQEQTNLSIDLLSGEEEAHYSFLGMLLHTKNLPKKGLMLDMGGGSTELHFFEENRSLFLYSCKFGALSLKNAFQKECFLKKEEEKALKNFVKKEIPEKAFDFSTDTAVLVGGTAKAAGTLMKAFFPSETNSNCFSYKTFEKLRDLLLSADEKRFMEIKELLPQRYFLMPAGVTALCTLLSAWNIRQVVISSSGMREGYLSKIHGERKLFYEEL